MILWTIQPEEVYEQIVRDGVYHCDFSKSDLCDMNLQYDWLVEQMKKRIGEPPAGVTYPVWAWYQWEGDRKKPDLRKERWGNGWKGEKFVCMEIDIPNEDVLLSDFDAWCIMLNNGLLSNSEEEDARLEAKYETLDDDGKARFRSDNWEGVFDLTPVSNDWMVRGDSIQATFWELRKEQIKAVRHFTAAHEKPKYLRDMEGKSDGRI